MLIATRLVLSIFLVAIVALSVGVASCQTYPTKPIRIGTGPGGGDNVARQIAQWISGPLGQPVIVENRGGVALSIELVAKAPPDGYTLLLAGSTAWILPLLNSNPLWDPVRDLSPITLATSQPNILVVHPSLPVKSVQELISFAKARPGALNYGSSTAGSASHLAAELFKSMAGVNIVGINYKGNEAATIALISGEVQVMLGAVSTVGPHIKSGKLRALAVTSTTPSALAPGLPTVAASGLHGYEAESVNAVFAPAKTPATIITRLNQEIVRILNRPEVKEKFLSVGLEAAPTSPEELAARIKSEMTSMGTVIKAAGIKVN